MKNAIFILFLLPVPLSAQYEALSAKHQAALKGLANERTRIDAIVNWAYEPANKAVERRYAEVALAQAGRIAYPAGRADALVKLGHIAADAGQYTEAETLYFKALHLRDSLHLQAGVASCYNNLGLLQKNQGHNLEAVALFERGLKQLNPDEGLGIQVALHNNLGAALWYRGECEQGYGHFEAAMRLGRHLKDTFGVASARFNMGALLQECQGLYGQAMDSLRRCLQDFTQLQNQEFIAKCYLLMGNNAYFTGEFPKALLWYQQAETLGNHLAKAERAILIKNRGRLYLDQQRYGEALRYFTTALDTFIALGNTREIATTRYELGNYHYEKSEFEAAVQSYKLALDSNQIDPQLKSQLLFFLPDALDQLGRTDEANAYRNDYKRFMEQMDSTQTRAAWRRLMLNGVSRQAILTRIERGERQAERSRLYGLLGIFGVSLVVATGGFFLNRQKRRLAERNAEIARQREALALQASELARQNEQLVIQEKLELLQNRELETQYARLEGQDNMQKEIGRELHDGVGATLSTVKLNLPIVEEVLDCIPPGKRAQYVQANQLLDQACEELRRVSHVLSSAVLDNFGLKTQLEIFAKAVSGSGKLQVELATHGLKGRFSDHKTAHSIYRMVQELVRNVIKHAKAKSVTIEVNHFEDSVNIIVEDDGQGFDAEAVQDKPGLGLSSLAARVQELNGEFQIDSRPGRGTTVSIDIPINK